MQNQKGNTSVIITFIIVVGVIILVIYALMQNTSNKTSSEIQEESATINTTNNNKNVSDQSQTPTKLMDSTKKTLQNFTPVSHISTLKKIDLVVGTGLEVKPGNTVSVHYIGAIAATGIIFQSSKDFGPTPITFPLERVIKGWTDGIPGMKVGGTRRLLIPSVEAYGANPPAGSGIPTNADLVFDVELIAIK